MNLWWLTLVILAAIPAFLFVVNLAIYRRLPQPSSGNSANSPSAGPVSVLIPARNEERNITAAISSVRASREIDFELIVMDDHSTDRTATLVEQQSAHDPRVRLVKAPPLPPGWNGKTHACFCLAQQARHPWLVFVDADVRLTSDALVRLVARLQSTGAAFTSGVPHQETSTLLDRLLLPLIHFVLLGFLPMAVLRRTRHPAFAAGCGQLVAVERSAYFRHGGHSTIKLALHDGLGLARSFRAGGFLTDLFDASDLATARLYQTNKEVWHGLKKNALEGMAHPKVIAPMTLLLFGGQVLPLLILTCGTPRTDGQRWLLLSALVLSFVPRVLGIVRFRQPIASALLHPLGVLVLLAIQWQALIDWLRGKPAEWKSRHYPTTLSSSLPVSTAPSPSSTSCVT